MENKNISAKEYSENMLGTAFPLPFQQEKVATLKNIAASRCVQLLKGSLKPKTTVLLMDADSQVEIAQKPLRIEYQT